jgi:hypothetical protein
MATEPASGAVLATHHYAFQSAIKSIMNLTFDSEISFGLFIMF